MTRDAGIGSGSLGTAHLTSVVRLAPGKYEARCDCGWRKVVTDPPGSNARGRGAKDAAWTHWAERPLVS